MTGGSSSRRRGAGNRNPGDMTDDSAQSIEASRVVAGRRQDLMDSVLELSSLMYFGSAEPFAELLRDRQVPEVPKRNPLDEAIADNMSNSTTQVSKKKDARREQSLLTALDVMQSSIREPEVIDNWSPHECAIFEAGFVKWGEEGLLNLVPLLPRKSIDDIEQFLNEVYRKTSRWKALQNVPLKID